MTLIKLHARRTGYLPMFWNTMQYLPPYFTLFRVTEVGEKEVTLMNKATCEKYKVPYGMCVWSTGVSPRELTQKKMQSFQNQKRG